MGQDIETYHPSPPGSAIRPAESIIDVPVAGQAGGEAETGSSLSLVGAVKRRWRTMILVAVLTIGIGLPYVWMTGVTTFKATAQLEVSPSLSPILRPDEKSGPMAFFQPFLAGLEHAIKKQEVLQLALQNPEVADLDIQQMAEPVVAFRKSTSVEILPNTYIVQIGVTQLQPEPALKLTRALVDAYLTSVVQAEDAETARTRKLLEAKREDGEQRVAEIQQQLRVLAEKHGSAAAETLEARLQESEKAIFEFKRELDKAETELLRLQSERALFETNITTSNPADQNWAAREALVNNDPRIQAMQARFNEELTRLLDLRSKLSPEHRGLMAAEADFKQLEADLQEERARVAKEADRRLNADTERQKREKLAQVEQQIALAKSLQDGLERKLREKEAEKANLGMTALDIRALIEEREQIKQDALLVEGRLKQIEVEQNRLGRIKTLSQAEIRPENIMDGRRKKSMMVVMAAAFLAVFAAMGKDLLDPSLRAPQQVESLTGLPVLGAVPCLSELKAGRITQEDFLESYRVVRAALAGLAGNGRPPQALLITSAQSGEGKTSLAVSLAASLAEPGGRVLLIDGDLQAPRIGQLLKVDRLDGLDIALTSEQPISELVAHSPLRGVDVLAARNNNAQRTMIDYAIASRVIREARAGYDHIVIDTPPALGAADALVWARLVDGVIMSSLAGQSDTAAMKLACQRLRTVSANMLGAVVGNVSMKDSYYSVSASRSMQRERQYWALTTSPRQRNLDIPMPPMDEPPGTH